MDDQLVTAEGKVTKYGEVSPREYIKIGTEDECSFDFTLTWTLAFTRDDQSRSEIVFALDKYGVGGEFCIIPGLNKKGRLLSAT